MVALVLIGAVVLTLVWLDRPRSRPACHKDSLIGRLLRLDF